MIKSLKTQQKVSVIGLVTFWPFCTYWRITKTDEWREKQQVSKHMKKPISSAKWISCMINTWWTPKNEMHPEIDKFPLKPEKGMKKLQGSRYYRNAHNSATQNDETWKQHKNTKAQANWISDISTNLMKNSLEIDQNTKMHEKTTKITVLPKQRICTFTNWHQPETCLQNTIR